MVSGKPESGGCGGLEKLRLYLDSIEIDQKASGVSKGIYAYTRSPRDDRSGGIVNGPERLYAKWKEMNFKVLIIVAGQLENGFRNRTVLETV